MTPDKLILKYNRPVPRYTSYPPANYFNETFGKQEYEKAIINSNTAQPEYLSFYIHIPFCRHLCHYCGCNSYPMMNKQAIDQYISALTKEMEMVFRLINPDRKIAQIHYGGGSPTVLPVKKLKELNDYMVSSFRLTDNAEIAIECHPGYLDEEYWQQLSNAGFNRFSLGIQDFDEKVLKTVNRRPSLLPVEGIFEILRKNDASINMDFLYGLPHQTVDGFAGAIHRAIELQPDRLVTFSYAHVPWVNKRQMILEKAGFPSSDEKSKMYATAKQILIHSGYKTIGMDHFVKETDELYMAFQTNQLHRNFQGYCTRRTTGQVYAFGVSGISQLHGGYAQNSKDIQTYIEQIERGLFATAKGYVLTYEEQVIRETIESLMCNYSIHWQELAERLKLPVKEIIYITGYNKEEFQAYADDGIISFDENHILISPQGTLFVRNIAASLDPLMKTSNKSFSKPV